MSDNKDFSMFSTNRLKELRESAVVFGRAEDIADYDEELNKRKNHSAY